MTDLGRLAVLLAGTALAAWILDLVRRGLLYVGYAIVLFVAVTTGVLVAVVPTLGRLLFGLVDGLFPGTSQLVVPLLVVGFALVYVLTQLTVLSNRVARLVRELSLYESPPPGRSDRPPDTRTPG